MGQPGFDLVLSPLLLAAMVLLGGGSALLWAVAEARTGTPPGIIIAAVEDAGYSAEPVHDAELWMGPASDFVAQGFEVAHEFGPYPVLRRAP